MAKVNDRSTNDRAQIKNLKRERLIVPSIVAEEIPTLVVAFSLDRVRDLSARLGAKGEDRRHEDVEAVGGLVLEELQLVHVQTVCQTVKFFLHRATNVVTTHPFVQRVVNGTCGESDKRDGHGVQDLAALERERAEKSTLDNGAEGSVGKGLGLVAVEGAVQEVVPGLEVVDAILREINATLMGARPRTAKGLRRMELIMRYDDLLGLGFEYASSGPGCIAEHAHDVVVKGFVSSDSVYVGIGFNGIIPTDPSKACPVLSKGPGIFEVKELFEILFAIVEKNSAIRRFAVEANLPTLRISSSTAPGAIIGVKRGIMTGGLKTEIGGGENTRGGLSAFGTSFVLGQNIADLIGRQMSHGLSKIESEY
jgi:hypothetical protein